MKSIVSIKGIILVIVILSIITSCIGCTKLENDRIIIETGDMFIFDDTSIDIDPDYEFSDFNKEYTTSECIVVVKFKKKVRK
jgi:hypothetical protein